MNPLKKFFESGQTILWIETQNTVAFLRPVPDILRLDSRPNCRSGSVSAPPPDTPHSPERFFSPLLFRHVSHRAHEFAVAECILCCVSQGVDMLDSSIGQQQTIGMLEIEAPPDARSMTA